MLKNYFKMALRNLRKQRGYSLLNIAGLSVGLTCFMLVILFIQYEFRYEKHHDNAARIYRIVVTQNLGDRVFNSTYSPVPLSETLARELPEVEAFTRFYFSRGVLSYRENRFTEDGISFVDPGVLQMFSFPLIKGDPETALKNKFSAVITRETAEKYFGQDDPIGKTMTLDSRTKLDVTVSGVMENHPPTPEIAPDVLIPLTTLEDVMPNAESFFQNWLSQQIRSYILLPEDHSVPEMRTKIMGVFKHHILPGDRRELELEQLARAHLYSIDESPGYIRTLYIFLACGILVLITACINFMNLATARSANRAREVGMRKVVGAARRQLIVQFMGESLVYAVASAIIAVGLTIAAIPVLNRMTGQLNSPADLGQSSIVLVLLGVTVLTGFIAGSYPALLLSGLQPSSVLRGRLSRGTGGSVLRRILVVTQFTISIVLIITTIIIGRQLAFIHNRDLGFQKEHIVVVQTQAGEATHNLEPLKTALNQNPRIRGVTGSMQLPSSTGMYNNVTWEGAADDEQIEIIHNTADYDFLDTYGIDLVMGRNFSPEFPTDVRSGREDVSAGAVILNQEALRRFGWDDPIGKKVIQTYGERRIYYTVIGVIKNFHFTSLHREIMPMNLFLGTDFNRYISIQILGENIRETLQFIDTTWKRIFPQLPFEHYFLDTAIERRYRAEENQRQLFGYLSGLAIFIACLGLFGLAAFAAEKRTKEIGIRKVLGASKPAVMALLSREFVFLVLAANILAWPAAFFVMHRWLGGFAYRIELAAQAGWFMLAAVLSLFIAVMTVGVQALRAASADPVRSLRYE